MAIKQFNLIGKTCPVFRPTVHMLHQKSTYFGKRLLHASLRYALDTFPSFVYVFVQFGHTTCGVANAALAYYLHKCWLATTLTP